MAASAFICEYLVAMKWEIVPRNFPQPRKTTFLHEFDLATIVMQMQIYTLSTNTDTYTHYQQTHRHTLCIER